MHKILCDFCQRDITAHDRLDIRLDLGQRDILKRKYGHWDVCLTCARGLDLAVLIMNEEEKAE